MADTMEQSFREMLKRKSSDTKSLLMTKHEYFLLLEEVKVASDTAKEAVLYPWQVCEQYLLVQQLEPESWLDYLDSGQINVLYYTIISSLIVYTYV